jgi:hypothetical protein
MSSSDRRNAMSFDSSPLPQQPIEAPSTRDETPSRGGFLGFLTSLPGVLTAAAGLVTAVTGAFGIYLSQDDGSSTPSTGGGTGTAAQGAPVPEGSGQVDIGGLTTGLTNASVDDEVSALMTDCAGGDAGACTTLLDTLAEECYQGYGISCDALYLVSAVGSAYEDYGATCGGRYDWTYAGVCSEL